MMHRKTLVVPKMFSFYVEYFAYIEYRENLSILAQYYYYYYYYLFVLKIHLNQKNVKPQTVHRNLVKEHAPAVEK